jgi:hypothetical protein
MTATVTLADSSSAYLLAQLVVTLTGSGCSTSKVHRDNSRDVHLTDDHLDALSALDDEHDGHYDGTYIWVGGTAYKVSRAAKA